MDQTKPHTTTITSTTTDRNIRVKSNKMATPERTFRRKNAEVTSIVAKQWIGQLMMTTVCPSCETYSPWIRDKKCPQPGCRNPIDYNALAKISYPDRNIVVKDISWLQTTAIKRLNSIPAAHLNLDASTDYQELYDFLCTELGNTPHPWKETNEYTRELTTLRSQVRNLVLIILK